MKYLSYLLLLMMFQFSCDKQSAGPTNPNIIDDPLDCMEAAMNKGFIEKKDNGRIMLYGGNGPTERDFDITKGLLSPCQFHYGLGRESFDALIRPEYITVEEASALYPDDERFLVATAGGKVAKAYSISLLTRHEVVNDVINGRPIMAAYCVLADLGAIYSRNYCDKTFTFGLSGYTYSDPDVWDGTDAFVFWDRETESLWWPLIDKAVSGDMLGTPLKKYSGIWFETTFDVLRDRYPYAQVLAPGQSLDPPKSWRHYDHPCK